MAFDMFIGRVIEEHGFTAPTTPSGAGGWTDLGGLLLPTDEEERLVEKIRYGMLDGIGSVQRLLEAYNERYADYRWTFAVSLMKEWLGKDELTEDDVTQLRQRGDAAHQAWLGMIKADAEKEYRLGDVDRQTLDKFLAQLG